MAYLVRELNRADECMLMIAGLQTLEIVHVFRREQFVHAHMSTHM